MRAKLLLTLIVIVFGASAVAAQEVPAYVFDLAPLLAQYGLTEEQINAFQVGAADLDWTGAEDIDPQMLAHVFEYGLSIEGGPIQNTLVFAHAWAHLIAQMSQMGLKDRRIRKTPVRRVARTRNRDQ